MSYFTKLFFLLAGFGLASSAPAVDSIAPIAQSTRPTELGGYSGGVWRLDRNADRSHQPAAETAGWGSPGDVPVVGDWNGDGVDDLGVFSGGAWFIDRNGDGAFDPATEMKGWGVAGWTPMAGDWNGDGITDLGVVSPDSVWFRDLNGDFAFDPATEMLGWGSPGDTPIVADWDGDGRDEVAVFSGGTWFIDFNGDGGFDPATEIKGWGVAGWTPLPGDWNGDGRTDLGVVSPDSVWFRDLNGDFGFDPVLEVLGWGSPGDTPIAADWNGDGRADPGVLSGSVWFADFNGNGGWEPNEVALGFGQPGDRVVAGRWGSAALQSGIVIDPPAGSTGVERNRRIILTLPAAVNPATVNAQTVQVWRGGAAAEVTRRVSYDGRYVMIATAMQSDQAVEVRVSGLQSAAGNPLPSLRATLTPGQGHGFGSFGPIFNSQDRFPTNAVIHVRYSQRLDPTSFVADQMALVRVADGKEFPVDCRLDPNWIDVVCTPLQELGAGFEYSLGGPTLENLFSSSTSRAFSFRAGFGIDTTPPRPIGSVPGDGSTLVSRSDGAVDVYFDEPVVFTADSVVELRRVGGSAVEVGVQGSTNSLNYLRFLPSSGSLQAGASYTIRVSGVRDLAGNVMAGEFQATFLQPPTSSGFGAVSVSPAPGEQDIALNASIVLTFSEFPVIPGTLTNETFSFRGPAGAVPFQWRAEADGFRVVIDPLEDLQPLALYRLSTPESFANFGGRELTATTHFQTGEHVDTTPPTILASWPPNGAVNQPLRTRPTVLLSEAPAESSVYAGGIRFLGPAAELPNLRLSLSGNTISLEPFFHNPLPANTLLTFVVEGVTDRAGNPLPGFVSQFRTGAFSDTTRPNVVSMTPAPGSVDVDLLQVVELTLDEPVLAATVTTDTVKLGDTPVAVTSTNGGLGIRIQPLQPMRAGAVYTVSVGATDGSGNLVSFPSSPSFTTIAGPADVTPPQVADFSIPEGALVEPDGGMLRYSVTFSEPVQPDTVDSVSLILLANGRRTNFAVQSQGADNRKFFVEAPVDTLRLAIQAQTDSEVYVEVIATDKILDFAGNGLSPEVTRSFRLAFPTPYDSSRLSLAAQQVRPTQMRASTTAPITFIFSKRFVTADPAQTMYVTQEGRLASGLVEVIAQDRALRFTPDQPWQAGALVQAFVRPTVFSADGGEEVSNALQPYTFYVDPAGHPGAPQVAAFSPPTIPCCGQPENPVNAQWMARLSEPADPATVTAESVRLLTSGDQIVPAAIALLNGDTVVATPTQALSATSSYRLDLTSTITDLEGNALAPVSSGWIQPKAPADSTAPAVTAVSPPNSWADIPLNAPIRVRFSEALNPAAVRDSQLTLACGGAAQALGPVQVSTYPSAYTLIEAVPEALLPAGRSCTATLSRMADVAGNLAPPMQWTFQTGAGVETQRLEDGATSPYGSPVGINTVVTVRFERRIDPTSIDPFDISFTAGSGNQFQTISSEYGLSADGLVFFAAPDALLPVGVQHSLRVNQGLRDLAGNSAPFYGVTFITGFAPDVAPPSVAGVTVVNDSLGGRHTIEDGATNVTPFLDLKIEMSEELDPATVNGANVEVLEGGMPLPVDVDLLYDRRTIQVFALSPLAYGRTYTLRIQALKDAVGNAMPSPYLLTFSTRPSNDTERPTAEHNMWGAGSFGLDDGVYRNVEAKILFSEPIDPATVRSDSIYYVDTRTGETLPSTPVLDAAGRLVLLSPDSPLPANARIEIKVSDAVTDLAGNQFWQKSFPFGSFPTGQAIEDNRPPVAAWPEILLLPTVTRNFPWAVLFEVVDEPLDPWTYSGARLSDIVEVRDSLGVLIQYGTVLQPSSEYTLTVQPAEDYAGNSLVRPDPITVTTSVFVDMTPPTVVSENPIGASTGVPVDTSITVDFSERIWISDIFLRRDYVSVVPFTYQLINDGTRLIVDPVDDLLPNTRYELAFYFYDLGNNRPTCCRNGYPLGFTTGGLLTPDVEAPVLLSINPPDGAMGVMDPVVTLTYSEPLDRASVQQGVSLYVNGGPSMQNAAVASGGTTIQIAPYGQLPAQAEIVVVGNGMTDLSGNVAAPVLSRFSYVNPQQTQEPALPRIQAVRPAAGAENVAQDASIYLFFSSPIDPATLANGLYVSEDGVLFGGDVVVTSGNQVVEFRPHRPFAAGALLRLFLDHSMVRTPEGTPLGNWIYESSFTAAGTPLGPLIRAELSFDYNTPRNAHLVVDFDRPMDPATFTPETVRLLNPTHPSSFSLENGNTRLRVIPEGLLPANRVMRLQLGSSIAAQDGATLSQTWHLTVGVSGEELLTPVTLTSISPPDGSTAVGVNGTIDLVFSENINRLTVDESTIRWTDGNGNGVACSIVVSRLGASSSIVRVTPHDPFTPLTAYTLTVDGIEDHAGNVAPARTISFTAGDEPDFESPKLVSSSPTGAGVPLNATAFLRFDEPLSSSTVDAGTVRLERFDSSTYRWVSVPAAVTLSSDAQTVFVTPDGLLTPASSYQVVMDSRVQDLSGNFASARVAFTAGSEVNTTPPAIVRQSPANGATDVAINQSIVFVFDSMIRPESVTDLVKLESGGVAIAVQRILNGNVLELRAPALLEPFTTYTWVVEGLSDLGGNGLAAALTGTFSTGASATVGAFEVVASSPAADASGVSRQAPVSLTFSQPINPRTVGPETFQLTDWDAGTDVPLGISYSADFTTVFLTPDQALPAESLCRMLFQNSGVLDLFGRRAESAHGVLFTTGP